MNYTLREAETQLRSIVSQTQNTYKPVVLMAEETAKPTAVLLNMEWLGKRKISFITATKKELEESYQAFERMMQQRAS
ncbi:MAG: hypothetical protein AAF639_23625 [Chloroflexota bacterium]